MLDFSIPSGYAVPNGGTQKFCRLNSKTSTIRQGEARDYQVTVYFDYVSLQNRNKTEFHVIYHFKAFKILISLMHWTSEFKVVDSLLFVLYK